MSDEKWVKRLERMKASRKEAERLLEEKSLELWHLNQDLENKVLQRTKELEIALEQAKQANIAKDEFLSNISHEIRTPMNGIIGFVDIMIRQKYDEAKFDKYLKIIQQSGKNLLSIINDILDFSKIQSGKFNINYANVNIKYSLESNIALYKAKANDKNITFNTNLSKEIPEHVYTDDTRVNQITGNFISNAIKFTPDGGEVNILVDYSDEELTVLVKDNGIGIEKEKQDKIFAPFEQEDNSTTKNYGGTGLGLSISLSLIKLMNGSLIFESEKNVGSTFGFIMPVSVSEKLT